MRKLLLLLCLAVPAYAQQPAGAVQIVAVNHAPTAGTQATASAAAIDGKRHVLYLACFSAAATTNPSATQLDINLKDGSTVKASFHLAVTAATGTLVAPFCTPPLHIRGTTNTAMTAEWSASLANLFQSVTLYYYDIPAGTN